MLSAYKSNELIVNMQKSEPSLEKEASFFVSQPKKDSGNLAMSFSDYKKN
jgi:hypothetical protein